MDSIVNMDDGQYEQRESLPGSSMDSDASSSLFESNDGSEQMSDNDKLSEDEEDLRDDLQKNVPNCYKSDLNFSSQTSSDFSNDSKDNEFQTTALCQFMDILNDLDEVLDKSLLACKDDGTKSLDSDDEDIICKLKDHTVVKDIDDVDSQSSVDDDTQVIVCTRSQCSNSQPEEAQENYDRSRNTNFGRSKSFTEVLKAKTAQPIECVNTVNEGLRTSMRRLDPIVLPTLTAEHTSCEPLTLPVILFLEHHVNMRPTSAPIQLQVTTNISSTDGASGPLIVGRRTLFMNRAQSLPSTGDSDVTNEVWPERDTARSTARSTSASSSSTESLVVSPINQNVITATTNERIERTVRERIAMWPHRWSGVLACLSCTLGIFNICRFSMFSINFGATFITQFILLSSIIGIPLVNLHLCLGQTLSSGAVEMWRISPIFQGVGIALLVAQIFMGLYTMIGLAWVMVFFRDSFITSDERYKWALPLNMSLEDVIAKNVTVKIEETMPLYFIKEVLKSNMGSNVGTVKFHLGFNLAVLWMFVFVALCKGLRSYGKAVYMLIPLPTCVMVAVFIKFLTLFSYETLTDLFPDRCLNDFWTCSSCWAAAAQEVFLTWGLLGACTMQLISHKDPRIKNNLSLFAESTIIVMVTLAVLLMGAVCANICFEILKGHGYFYLPGSFETLSSSKFLFHVEKGQNPEHAPSHPMTKYMGHYGSIVGYTAWSIVTGDKFSGWQPLQLATQMVPATLAVLPSDVISPVWAVMFYYMLIMFGIGQQVAIWHCVITGIKAFETAFHRWDTTLTFVSCVVGIAVGLLLSTDCGIRVVHFVDYVCAGAWWHIVLHSVLLVAVFAVRGRPIAADALATGVVFAGRRRGPFVYTWATLLSFVWTVVMPVGLCTISIMDFRVGKQRQLYMWRIPTGYWPVWLRQLAVLIQQGTLFLVPAWAFVQTWKYMSNGPPDIFERIQNLYRPHMGDINGVTSRVSFDPPTQEAPAATTPPDLPPKYTPPPSYSTATGGRLFDNVRRSFRTLRRITSSRVESADGQHAPITLSENVERHSEPPRSPAQPPSMIHHEVEREVGALHSTHGQFARSHLRRSFLRAESLARLRASMRRSLRGGFPSGSHEWLVRHAEPPHSQPSII